MISIVVNDRKVVDLVSDLFFSSCGCFFFKQKTAYEMRISDWSSDVCSSDLAHIALLCYADGERRYIIAPRGLEVGAKLVSGLDAPIRAGNTLPIRAIDRKSVVSGKSVSVRVDIGGRRIIKTKKQLITQY